MQNEFQIRCLKIISTAAGCVIGVQTYASIYHIIIMCKSILCKIKINSNFISFFFPECSACGNSDIYIYIILRDRIILNTLC